VWFLKCLNFFKVNKYANKENIIFFILGPDKVWPCSYVFSLGMENQGYVVIIENLIVEVFNIF